ncbi:MAG: bifunctional pyr operon transcriptional regulator/uracil phosphoribosyltransferase PyrR [Deltaproteobacteria bacterium]|jgi:pyrimidine operon attenuation protein/uracil phosphoribosyltransferase|nr:bifunctional pyr operon transcriptional regulator/uracil phosphoribosyltransferase PyrR [Deltaproteobacteria bacterium]MCL5879846.1 bifunctional pyr operon transcriptional regulator/uracil phosphoribosyltransferase PyrR [Deltaproteobacteria bacterium]MDA8303871.1 bifunctional pyr operon transcriptional regulator/uracil phosphoribosyltransferase PyrR [Deltaproteobacteria bacterium]
MVSSDDFKKLDKILLFNDSATNDILNDFIGSVLKSIETQARSAKAVGFSNTVIIGIKEGGVPLAGLIKKNIKNHFKIDCEIGYVDMTLYRDDPFTVKKPIKSTELPFDIGDKDVILVDDVISSGRTVRAAIDEIFDFGRPKSIRLAVFIDKGGRELPICPDFVGKKIEAGKDEIIHVDIISKEKRVDKIIKT